VLKKLNKATPFTQTIVSAVSAGGGTALSLLIGAAGGIILVRILQPDDYARYSIAVACYGTIQQLADGGTTSGAQNIARTNWQVSSHVAQAMAAARVVRRGLSLLCFPAGAVIAGLLTTQHGAGPTHAVMTGILVALAAWATNESSLRSVPLYLDQRITQVQIAQVLSDLLRLAGLFGLVWWFRDDVVALSVFASGFFFRNWLLGRNLGSGFKQASKAPGEMIASVREFVRRIRPVWVYACFSGSISIFLASLFGTTDSVAAVGGLARVSMLLSVGGFVFGSIVAPRFARENNPAAISKKFLLSLAALVAINLCSLLPFFLFPQIGLLLIGDDYTGLESELRITCAGAALNGIYGGIYTLAVSRGNLLKPWTYLAVVLTWQVILFSVLEVSTLQGVLWLGTLTPIPGIIAYLIAALNGVARERKSAGLPPWSQWVRRPKVPAASPE
jgi:hypothetical protein